MKRELEKYLAVKVSEYQTGLRIKFNGVIPKSKSDLMFDFYNYLLSNSIESLKDIPKKYQEIIQ